MDGVGSTLSSDVLVIGGGGAGARAALEAAQLGAEVILAVKGSFGTIGTRGSGSTAGGVSDRGGIDYPGAPGIQGFGRKNKLTPEQDYENIIELGLGMTDRRLAQIMAERSEEIIRPLAEEWTTEIFPRQWGMKSHGIPIMYALLPRIKRSSVKILEYTMVLDLLLENGEVAGALAVDEKTGELIIIEASAVIMTTGGEGAMFTHFVTNHCTTGDGYAMAYRAGGQLMNLEFKQLFPAIIHPTVNHFSAWFFVPHVRIYNEEGEEYIHKYLPDGISIQDVYTQRAGHGPFSARDNASRFFDIATVGETKAGRANKNGALYVDLTDERIIDPLDPQRKEYFYYRGIRYLEEPIEFNICFHCSNGGIRIDTNGESNVPGLYAAGESMSGPHGANRLAGHMLGCSQVFGTISARHAVKQYAKRGRKRLDTFHIKEIVDSWRSLRNREGLITVDKIIEKLRWVNWSSFMPYTDEATLIQAQRSIKELKDQTLHMQIKSTDEFIKAAELSNMLVVSEMLAKVIEIRKESRGDHYRHDYPERNDEKWAHVLTIQKKNESMSIEKEVIDPEWKLENRTGDMSGLHWG